MSETLLKVSGLTMRFGGLLAVDSVAFEVRRDEVFAIIGPNGAGKTTVFNCVGGFYKPTAGEIVMDGKPITGMPSHKVARHGLVRTFQNVRLFKQLTVLENLLVAQHTQVEARLLPGLLKLKSYRQAEAEALTRAAQWLDFMGLREFANREAGNLAYGHQRRLEIARCMITAAPADARRAGRRPEPAGKARPAVADRSVAARVRRRGAADRARHEPDHGNIRPHPCHGTRQAHHDRHPR